MSQFDQTLNKWQSGHLTDGQMALAYFLHYYQLKYSNPKLAAFLQENGDPLQALKRFQFKKVKGKALICLEKWAQGQWNLKLECKIFTPVEVLQLQAQGIRPVSMLLRPTLTPVLHRTDCLDFFLHDLEHGYMFFADEELKMMQINFFQRVLRSLQTDLWHSYLQDQDFVAKFHYLISDMNTHIEHYRGYLFSMINREDVDRFQSELFPGV